MVAECFGSRKHMPAPNFIFMFKTIYIMFLLTMNIDEPQQVKSKHRLQPELHRVFVPSLFLFVDMSLDNGKKLQPAIACTQLLSFLASAVRRAERRAESRRGAQRRAKARRGARRLRRAEARRGAQSHTEARGAQRRAKARRGLIYIDIS